MARISQVAAALLLLLCVPAHASPSATDKLIKKAERNLVELTRWSSGVAGGAALQLSDDSRSALFRIHSETQRSVRALTIAARDDVSRQFASGYQEFAASLRDLHRAVVLGQDSTEYLSRSVREASNLMALIKDIETPVAQRESVGSLPSAGLSD